jgi:chemotaxis protein methyltransferase CheR
MIHFPQRKLLLQAQFEGSGGSDAAATTREFTWTDKDFDRVQAMIYKRAGISLHDGKHAMVYSRLSRRLRDTGHQSFNDYLGWLDASDGPEWQEFVNALTTNLTSFFRESHHFEILSDFLKSKTLVGPLKIWCSASSTGEEPYSIAMTVLESIGSRSGFSLMASDIDSKVLASAQQGVYRLDSLKGVDSERLQRYFLRGKGGNDGMVMIKPEVKNFIQFLMVNLIRDDWPFKDLFDVVFCRNVMIYFDAATQRRVLERIYKVMKPGALLFVGHAENFSDSRDLFVLKGKTVYERQ